MFFFIGTFSYGFSNRFLQLFYDISFFPAAAHPQVRRKLEDVSLKLDILYDKLRKSVLSPTTLQGLHTILQHIWQYDYQSCMQVNLYLYFSHGITLHFVR